MALLCSKEMPRTPVQGEDSLEECGTYGEIWGCIQNPQNKVLPPVDQRDSKPSPEAYTIESTLKHFQQLGKYLEMECDR